MCSGRLGQATQAVRGRVMFFFCYKETPEWLCGLENASTDIVLSRKWVKMGETAILGELILSIEGKLRLPRVHFSICFPLAESNAAIFAKPNTYE